MAENLLGMSDRRFMFMKIFLAQGVVCPFPGTIFMYMTIIFKQLPLIGRKMKGCINGQGHMTKMAAFKNFLPENQKAYEFETWHEASGNGALQSLHKS